MGKSPPTWVILHYFAGAFIGNWVKNAAAGTQTDMMIWNVSMAEAAYPIAPQLRPLNCITGATEINIDACTNERIFNKNGKKNVHPKK